MLCASCGSWGALSQFAQIGSCKAGVIGVLCAIYEPIISWNSVICNLSAIKWHVDARLGRWGCSRTVCAVERDGDPYAWLGKCGCNLPHFSVSFWHSVTRLLEDDRIVLPLLCNQMKISSKLSRLLKITRYETRILERLRLLNIQLPWFRSSLFYSTILLCTSQNHFPAWPVSPSGLKTPADSLHKSALWFLPDPGGLNGVLFQTYAF